MGQRAHGELIFVDDATARYTLAGNAQERLGVLVIPVDDPWSWHLEDADGKPEAATFVVVKILRRFEQTGEWPALAYFQS